MPLCVLDISYWTRSILIHIKYLCNLTLLSCAWQVHGVINKPVFLGYIQGYWLNCFPNSAVKWSSVQGAFKMPKGSMSKTLTIYIKCTYNVPPQSMNVNIFRELHFVLFDFQINFKEWIQLKSRQLCALKENSQFHWFLPPIGRKGKLRPRLSGWQIHTWTVWPNCFSILALSP